MMGELKSVDVREVYSEKVCRVTLDIPFSDIERADVGGMSAMDFLNQRVGRKAGINFTTLDDEQKRMEGEDWAMNKGD